MPTWGEILRELKGISAQNEELIKSGQATLAVAPFDVVRRKYLKALAEHTKRAAILYASRWTQPSPGVGPEMISITAEDMQGFMEAMHGLGTDALDLIIHLPGGSAEATESLVSYIRSKFRDVRIFIPHAAMSAATMLACAADRIVMGKHSYLGPIDPQFILQTEIGRVSIAAHAIEEQFTLAKEEITKQPALLSAWLPMLRQYGPALIVQCKLARDLSESLVTSWLAEYMFAGVQEKKELAAQIAKKLANHAEFKSHSRFINRIQAKEFGLVVDELEKDQTLQDSVLSVFHAVTHTFNGTPCAKIIENHLGKAFIKSVQQQIVLQQPQPPIPLPMQPPIKLPPSPS
jgi:hypothetical protein